MRSHPSRSIRRLMVSALAAAAASASAGVLGVELERSLATRGSHADTAVIVRFDKPVDIAALTVGDRRTRDNRLMQALKERALQHRLAIEPWLRARGAERVRDLWIVNGLALTLPAFAVKDLAAQPGVEHIELDSRVQGGRSQRTPASHSLRADARSSPVPPVPAPDAPAPASPAPASAPPAWNIAAVKAPALRALGYSGQGVVVATMDTGADLAHPALRGKWRGGTNGWFDPHGQEATPHDASGHGTQALGVILGGPAMAVAPDARWIAARLYDADGRASMSDIHRAFQWLLDPDGDPATVDAPDVVNASWALTGRAMGACIREFEVDIRVLKAAGIAVVFAAGNDGPMAATSNSPGNNAGVVSVGAVDRDLAVERQSSRGPSSCDGAVFPRLVAPGTGVRTADLSHGGQASYTTVSGSSLAAPHVAGVLALLAGAFPSASVAELEAALASSARDLGVPGPDPVYGNGLVDALAAYETLRGRHAIGVAAGRR